MAKMKETGSVPKSTEIADEIGKNSGNNTNDDKQDSQNASNIPNFHVPPKDPAEIARIMDNIWTPPTNWTREGTWFWWFWLFFIHDKDTHLTGKCRQIMILWSIKKDREIKCNALDIRIPDQLQKAGDKWLLNGAAAAWYFDGAQMREDFVLEKSKMILDTNERIMIAPGNTPSEFYYNGKEFVTTIKTGDISFELKATKTDNHPKVGPNYGKTKLPLGMETEGTMIEIMELAGFETGKNGKQEKIHGTAYFQKICIAAPPPQWYWGVYHFKDGSFFTYMQTYFGRAMFSDNLWKGSSLRVPHMSLSKDIQFYHAPSKRFFQGHGLVIKPVRIEGTKLWTHEITGSGEGFEISAKASSYAHACWSFEKNLGILPIKSTFKYNEYPSTVPALELTVLATGEKIRVENGWGNMENTWGVLI